MIDFWHPFMEFVFRKYEGERERKKERRLEMKRRHLRVKVILHALRQALNKQIGVHREKVLSVIFLFSSQCRCWLSFLCVCVSVCSCRIDFLVALFLIRKHEIVTGWRWASALDDATFQWWLLFIAMFISFLFFRYLSSENKSQSHLGWPIVVHLPFQVEWT